MVKSLPSVASILHAPLGKNVPLTCVHRLRPCHALKTESHIKVPNDWANEDGYLRMAGIWRCRTWLFFNYIRRPQIRIVEGVFIENAVMIALQTPYL